MYGVTRQYIRDKAGDTGTNPSIRDGWGQMVPARAICLAARGLTHVSGLVGSPEQTQGGSMRCLFKPHLPVGGRISLNNVSVKAMLPPWKQEAGQQTARMDADGLYHILKVELCGNPPGNDRYAYVVCIGNDDTERLPAEIVSFV